MRLVSFAFGFSAACGVDAIGIYGMLMPASAVAAVCFCFRCADIASLHDAAEFFSNRDTIAEEMGVALGQVRVCVC